jgi:hypothetical protein
VALSLHLLQNETKQNSPLDFHGKLFRELLKLLRCCQYSGKVDVHRAPRELLVNGKNAGLEVTTGNRAK